MSVQASAWAWSLRGLPSHLKLTLLAIADSCNATGYGYPGQARLAEQLECGERQVRYNVAALAKLDLLEVIIRPGTGGGRRSNAYQLHLERTQATGNALPEASGNSLPGATGNATPGNRQCSVGQPAIAIAYEPLEEPSEEPSECVCAPSERPERPATGSTPGFDRFWATWPSGQRKRGRKTALAVWRGHHLEPLTDMIVADVQHRSQADDWWLRGYAPMPATYLRGARWEDELGGRPPQRELSPSLRGILSLEKYKCPSPTPGSAP
jgi:hypothetical protein